MFPAKLNRTQYLVRWLIMVLGVGVMAALGIPLLQRLQDTAFVYGLFVIVPVVFILRVVALDIPRMRSIGWNPWLLLLALIPLIGGVMQVLLFVVAPAPELTASSELPMKT